MNRLNSSERWRRLPPDLAQHTAGWQLAHSESLFTDLTSPVLWWYCAASPALILGTAQKPDIVDRRELEKRGMQLYRRSSGGAVVLAEPDFLSLDIALPPGHPLAPTDVTETYRWLGEAWLDTLAEMGVSYPRLVPVEEVRAARRERENWDAGQLYRHSLVNLVCFGTLSPYEVAVGERKLVGLSQVRRRAGVLLQCGLPLKPQASRFAGLLALSGDDQENLSALLPSRLASLEEVMEDPAAIPPEPGSLLNRVIEQFEKTLRVKWGIEPVDTHWSSLETEQAATLEATRFQPL